MTKASKVAAALVGAISVAAAVFLWQQGLFVSPSAPSTSSRQTVAPAASEECGSTDLVCLGSKGRFLAAEYCKAPIERLAQYSVRWTDNYSAPKFSKFNWTKEPGGPITYIGDRIEFQTALGAYQPMYYLCDVAIDGKSVTGVRAYPGRLP